MIPRVDPQPYDLIPYTPTFPGSPGLIVRDVEVGIFSIANDAFITTAKNLYTSSKIQFTAVVLVACGTLLSLHLFITNILLRKPSNGEEIVTPIEAVLVVECVVSLLLYISYVPIYQFVKGNTLLSSKEIGFCRPFMGVSQINKMDYKQFFECLRLWNEFNESEGGRHKNSLEPAKRAIVNQVTIWRNISLEHFVEICQGRVEEVRKIIREKPYLYPFLIEHLPDHCRSAEQLLTRLNPFFSDSLTANLLNQLDESFFIPSSEETSGSAAASSSRSWQLSNYFNIRFKCGNEILVKKEHLTLRSSFFSRERNEPHIFLDSITRHEFQILHHFLNYGENEINDGNVQLLYKIACDLEFSNDIILVILKHLARRIDSLQDSFFENLKIVSAFQTEEEQNLLQKILDALEQRIFRSRERSVFEKAGRFLAKIGHPNTHSDLLQNIQHEIEKRIQNMLESDHTIEYLSETLNGIKCVTSYKMRKQYQKDLFKILKEKNWDRTGYNYPIDTLWRHATEHNHQDLKNLVKDFAHSPEGEESLMHTKLASGWFLLPAEWNVGAGI